MKLEGSTAWRIKRGREKESGWAAASGMECPCSLRCRVSGSVVLIMKCLEQTAQSRDCVVCLCALLLRGEGRLLAWRWKPSSTEWAALGGSIMRCYRYRGSRLGKVSDSCVTVLYNEWSAVMDAPLGCQREPEAHIQSLGGSQPA